MDAQEPLEPVNHASMTERVTHRIREAILHGQLQAGEKISVQRLAESLGTSHIPVREALRRLEGEALVTTQAHRWTVVSGLSLEELTDVYELRRLIEGSTATRSAGRFTEADLGELQRLLDATRDSDHISGGEAFWQAHRRLHMAVLEPGLTPWSRRLLRLLWQSAERYQRLYAMVPGSVDTANHDHEEIVRMTMARDGEGLAAATVRHLHHTEAALREARLASNSPS